MERREIWDTFSSVCPRFVHPCSCPLRTDQVVAPNPADVVLWAEAVCLRSDFLFLGCMLHLLQVSCASLTPLKYLRLSAEFNFPGEFP